MAIAILETPSVTEGSTECKYNCAHQPYIFKVRRQDAGVSSFTDEGSGIIRIEVPDTTGMLTGDSVFIQISSVTSGVDYSSVYTVTTVVDGTHFEFLFAGSFGDIASMSYVNYLTQYKNYYIRTNVQNENNNGSLGKLRHTPAPSGFVAINIEAIVKTQCKFNNTFKYNVINWRDVSLGGGIYTVEFTEVYDNEDAGGTSSKTWMYANAVKQIQEKYGTNLMDFYPSLDLALTANKPKFMSDFVRPTYFVGYPFDLTFIKWNDDDTPWNRWHTNLDINGGTISDSTVGLESGQYIHRLMLDEDVPGTKKITVAITDEEEEQLTELKEIKVNNNCQQNPIYLCWLGKRGGINYWLFNKTQTKGKQVLNAMEFSKNTENIETEIGAQEFYSKDITPQYILGATVKKEDLDGISTMLDSVSVLMLTNPDTWKTDGIKGSPLPKWIRVRPQGGAFKIYETENEYATIEIIIELPQLYNQTQ